MADEGSLLFFPLCSSSRGCRFVSRRMARWPACVLLLTVCMRVARGSSSRLPLQSREVLEALGFTVSAKEEDGSWNAPFQVQNRCDVKRVAASKAAKALKILEKSKTKDVDVKPFLISGLAEAWNASRGWGNRESFLSEYGELTAEVGDPAAVQAYGGRSGAMTKMSLRKFLSNPHERGHVVFSVASNRKFKRLLSDVQLPKVFEDFSGTDKTSFLLSFGHDGAGLSPHVHGDTWLTLVVGLKLWVFEPPSKVSWAPRHGSYIRSLVKEGPPSHAILCLQHPGDTVFVPTDWGHATVNIGVTLAVGQQKPPGAVNPRVYHENPQNIHTLLRAAMAARGKGLLKQVNKILAADPYNAEGFGLLIGAKHTNPDRSDREQAEICKTASDRMLEWMRANDPDDELATVALEHYKEICSESNEL
eukprot:TRINITY_DN67837_c0_g1_i1.p1 TRINITY_DN67837_c0_g1~~TRINITY_DN67837_c0_g1_i1.p1  ORF type:complete len:437 (+),score=53.76 TRINITY_DN67837_c0_g1_i1:56-1312(+)